MRNSPPPPPGWGIVVEVRKKGPSLLRLQVPGGNTSVVVGFGLE